jgi:hypothetical protein
MILTLGNLRLWSKALATGTPLSPVAQALPQHTIPLTNGLTYGLGIIDLFEFFGHGGKLLGHNSAMYHLPSSDATLLVLANEGNLGSAGALGTFAGLASYLFPQQFPSGPENPPSPE